MEEKVKKDVQNKLSYEELEMAARQLTVQLDNLAKENKQLKINLEQLKMTSIYTELDFRFKVLDYSSYFSDDFISKCTKTIEQIMSPKEEENSEETKVD